MHTLALDGPSKSTSICFTNLVHKQQMNKWYVSVFFSSFFLLFLAISSMSVKQIGRESVSISLVLKIVFSSSSASIELSSTYTIYTAIKTHFPNHNPYALCV